MKQMTTAEFGKATLSTLTEPVEVRRYTTVVGTYYPAGYEPVTALAMGALPEVVPLADLKRLEEQSEEIARLKRELAARPARVEAVRRTDDPFADLAKQDRDFFDRKMGKKK